ncbi:MAG: phosphatase PAP2 family protein [Oscillospiraceae bacterium]
MSRRKKILCCAVCGYLGLSTGTICSAAMLNYEGLGMMFPDTEFSFGIILLVNILAVYPLFFAGIAVNQKRYDSVVIKRIISLLILLTAAFIIPQLIKHCVQRPRYRMTLQGYSDIGFIPWYIPFQNADILMKKYGIDSNSFGSFPSGHALSAMLNIIIFPALSWVIPNLKGKESLLGLIGSLSCISIMISRMMLGAHYLSDVSFGALIGIVLSFVFLKIQERISEKSEAG